MSEFHISSQNLQGIALFSEKIYTGGKKFTRPPVVTVATNFKSGQAVPLQCWSFLLVLANFQTFYPILEQRIIDKKKVLSSLIVCNAMKNIGYCIKLHLPFIVLMISATLYIGIL